MEIIKDIEGYLNNNKKHNIFFDLYSFSNENISGYISYFDLKNKSLLTVGSSCDQAINAFLEGCEDITICDVCPLTKYYYYLKLAAILSLKREELLKFLCETNYNIENNPYLFNKETFNKIKTTLMSLDYDSYYLWDYLISMYNKYELERLFRRDINVKDSIINCNNYLKSENNYKKLKKIINNITVNFINGNVINEEYNRTFDNIWLSNVAHYLKGEEVIKLFFNNEKALNEEGKMLLCYFWNNITNIKDVRIEEFQYIESEKIIIPGISVYEDDSILLCSKSKKL